MAKRVYGILSLFFRICRSGQWECNAATSTESSPFFFARDSNLHTLDDHTAASICRCVEKNWRKKISSQTISSSAHSPLYTLFSPLIFFCCTIFNSFLCFCSLSLSPIAIVVFRLRHASFFLLIAVFSSSSSFSWALCSVPRYILYCFLLSFEKFHGMETLCLVANHTQQQQKKIHPALIFLCDFGESRKKGFPWWSKGWHLPVRIVWIFLFSLFYVLRARLFFRTNLRQHWNDRMGSLFCDVCNSPHLFMFPPPSVSEIESNGRRHRRITRRPIMLRVVSRVSMSDLLGKELTLPRFRSFVVVNFSRLRYLNINSINSSSSSKESSSWLPTITSRNDNFSPRSSFHRLISSVGRCRRS